MNRHFCDDEKVFSETYQNDRIVKSAKRTSFHPIYIRRERFDPIWRSVPFSSVLQIHWTETLSTDICPLACLLLQNLSSSRYFSGAPLCYCCRYRKNRKYTILDPQWSDSTNSGAARISPSGHFENFPLAIQLTQSFFFAASKG